MVFCRGPWSRGPVVPWSCGQPKLQFELRQSHWIALDTGRYRWIAIERAFPSDHFRSRVPLRRGFLFTGGNFPPFNPFNVLTQLTPFQSRGLVVPRSAATCSHLHKSALFFFLHFQPVAPTLKSRDGWFRTSCFSTIKSLDFVDCGLVDSSPPTLDRSAPCQANPREVSASDPNLSGALKRGQVSSSGAKRG